MDADLEIYSLKDSVWKLNTRVLVLENFIAQQFGTNALGEVHKRKFSSTIPATSTIPTSRPQNRSSPNKRLHSVSSTEKQFSNQKSFSTSQIQPSRNKREVAKRVNYNEEDEDSCEEYYAENPISENDITLLVPKNEPTEEGVNESSVEIDLTEMNAMDSIEENSSHDAAEKFTMTEEMKASFLRDDTNSTPQSKSMPSKSCMSHIPLETVGQTLPQTPKIVRKRAKRSVIHDHFTLGEDLVFVCHHCGLQYKQFKPPHEASTTRMLTHLRAKHPEVLIPSQKIENT